MSLIPSRNYKLEPDTARSAAFVLKIDGTEQSYVDLDDPTHLEFDYIQRMADAVDSFETTGRSLRFVHIGGAAMTLPRYFVSTRPRSPQIVLEPDADLTAHVREKLPLPAGSGIKVRPVGGVEGLSVMREDYADVVILDAFDGSRVPAELTTQQFFADVARVLMPDGLFLLNIADVAPFDYTSRVIAALRLSFAFMFTSAETATAKGRRFGNMLVGASAADIPVSEIKAKAARSPFPYRVTGQAQLSSVFGKATAFTADDAEMSPARPGGKTYFW